MSTYAEDRFGEIASLGTTYTIVGAAVPSVTKWNVLVNVTNRTAAASLLRLYIADTSWTTGEPTGGTLKVALAYDRSIAAGAVVQITGIIMKTTEKLIARASVAASLDICANGVAIT